MVAHAMATGYAIPVGVIQALRYEVPRPNTAQVAMQHVAATRLNAWFSARTLHHVDRVLLRLSRGRVTVTGVVAGLPVVTVTTTGARTGQRRTTPLLGVPVGEDLAVIGTNFGQPHTPGWYYNMRAEPRVEVAYRDRNVEAVAREADEQERQAISQRARKLYVGYDAYAGRVKGREIHTMVLSA